MKKLNLLDLVDGKGVCIHEGLLSCNSVQYYKPLNPNNMMREKSRKVFTLKKEAVTEVVFDDVAKCLKKKVKGYQSSPARTYEAYRDLLKGIQQAPGKLIVVGVKEGKMLNEKALIISSEMDLREKVSTLQMNKKSLYQHLVESIQNNQVDAFEIIQLAEVL